MIHLLEFKGSLYEFNGSYGRTSKAIKEICDRFDRTMLLHRYDLGFYHYHKHQCKNPERLILEKLDGKKLCMLHLDLYADCPEKIEELLDYCESKGIDFFAPVSDGDPGRWNSKDIPGRHMQLRSIMEQRDHIVYDFKDTGAAKDFDRCLSLMIRDINLKEILD
jgi:hypothetical protein